MAEGDRENAASAGTSSSAEVDVAALFAQLKEEVRRVGPRPAAGAGPSVARLNARAAAERLWPVSAERPPAGRGGPVGALLKPVKLVLRRLMRWYVEPALADQRAFNDAMLKLIDDIYEQLDAAAASPAAPKADEDANGPAQ